MLTTDAITWDAVKFGGRPYVLELAGTLRFPQGQQGMSMPKVAPDGDSGNGQVHAKGTVVAQLQLAVARQEGGPCVAKPRRYVKSLDF